MARKRQYGAKARTLTGQEHPSVRYYYARTVPQEVTRRFSVSCHGDWLSKVKRAARKYKLNFTTYVRACVEAVAFRDPRALAMGQIEAEDAAIQKIIEERLGDTSHHEEAERNYRIGDPCPHCNGTGKKPEPWDV